MKKLTLEKLKPLLQQSGLYDRIPNVKQPNQADFDEVLEKIDEKDTK